MTWPFLLTIWLLGFQGSCDIPRTPQKSHPTRSYLLILRTAQAGKLQYQQPARLASPLPKKCTGPHSRWQIPSWWLGQHGELLKAYTFILFYLLAQGRTNHLGHDCIKWCCTFFYKGDNALARYFPDNFKNAVPEHAIALVITCVSYFIHFNHLLTPSSQIKNCLEQYASGHRKSIQVTFNGNRYSSFFNYMMHIIKGLKKNCYHHEKWEANHQQ